jgi:hypothetical protein
MAYDPKLGYSDPTQVQQNQIGFAPEDSALRATVYLVKRKL